MSSGKAWDPSPDEQVVAARLSLAVIAHRVGASHGELVDVMESLGLAPWQTTDSLSSV